MERDFTLKKYTDYLIAIKQNYEHILTFSDYLTLKKKSECFALIRHDVDRKPLNALTMAKLEFEHGVRSTYYFRVKSHTFKPDIIKKVAAFGHEIGFHYESLSDANGDFEKAYDYFCSDLEKIRNIAPINTISMHGRPLKPYDNRDLWKHENFNQKLKQQLGIMGEVYLDIDYSNIAYINDTGRNWLNNSANLRDKVISNIKADFHDSEQLLYYLKHKPHPQLVFQTHPERWSSNNLEWTVQATKDFAINQLKKIIISMRGNK